MIPCRGWLIPIVAASILILTGVRARADDPPGIDCATVRYYVAIHGKLKAIIWAKQNGYSLAEIAEARKCLKGK